MANQAADFEGGFAAQGLAETEELARRIAPRLCRGDSIALEGDLGAGKTTFVRAILRAMGVMDEIPSPSFTLVQEYESGGLKIAHCDLYRIESATELDELGMDEALRNGVVLIEWPERATARIPPDALRIRIDVKGETARQFTFRGPPRWADLVNERT